MRRIGTGTVLAAMALLVAPAGALAHGGSTEPGDEPALCEPYLAVAAAFNSDEPDPAAIEELLVEAEGVVPDDLTETFGTVAGAARSVIETGDFAAFETPDVTDAMSAMDTWVFELCPFDTTIDVAASEYAFGGLPEEIPAGRVAIMLHNTGEEVHEIIVVRRLEGVTEPWEALLALPEEEVETKVEFLGAAFAPSSGSQGLLTGEFVPGDYLALCFVPEGTAVADDGSMTEGAGTPHFMHGMQQEFTVTG